MIANFKYDGDSKRIRATINGGLDTVFIGNYFEWNVATQTKRTYYFAGATRIAMREGSGDTGSAGAGTQWILGDHTGFAGASSGQHQQDGLLRRSRYRRAVVQGLGGDAPANRHDTTKYQYTGQYNQVIIGLYYYGARWYDTTLGRFVNPILMYQKVKMEKVWIDIHT